jgi:hypothetical protein
LSSTPICSSLSIQSIELIFLKRLVLDSLCCPECISEVEALKVEVIVNNGDKQERQEMEIDRTYPYHYNHGRLLYEE